jgi:hypothetical protein
LRIAFRIASIDPATVSEFLSQLAPHNRPEAYPVPRPSGQVAI